MTDDDVPTLSASTFQILQEFYKEQEERELQLNYIRDHAATDNVLLEEDWQLSQFWYDENTVNTLANLALNLIGPDGNLALISCPTLYKKCKELIKNVTLFEYDKRFAVYGEDFILYDYKSLLEVPRDKASYYDLVIADPPFLSEECLTKTALTMKFLVKRNMILCTGAVMTDLANRLLDLQKTNFQPHHQNNLANEFCCYANFDVDLYIKQKQ